MKLSPFAIEKLTPFITGDGCPPGRKGQELVELFNTHGCRDVYDSKGLPANPEREDGQRMSRKQYVKNRLNKLSGNQNLRLLLEVVVNEADDKADAVARINEIIREEGFVVRETGGRYHIQGGVINRTPPVNNEAHFQNIQNTILTELDGAKISIWIAMAWFTNQELADKLIEKSKAGVDVQLVIYNDGVNKKHGVDLSGLKHTLVRGDRGGLMHNKFCVIDNQSVITGSYNWSNNAEYKNDENISVLRDPERATEYSQEYKRLAKS